MSEWLHPAWPCLLGAAIGAVGPRTARRGAPLAGTVLALALATVLPDGTLSATLMGQSLTWLRLDDLGRAFAVIFALIGSLGLLYGLAAPGRRLAVAAAAATGGALLVVLAGDWLVLYLGWETLAVASFFLVLDGGTGRARGAALRYLLVHLAGGAALLAGIAWLQVAGGPREVGPLQATGPGLLVLAGFAVNAAVPPLHAWLTDAYPESSTAGSVLLSAFATKAAVYALARVFPGLEPLAWVGALMAMYGVVFAVLENDIRRLLGYHIVSQVGYMVAGVGLGTPLALDGTVAHALCHILYKGLLFMAAGAVIHASGRRKLSDLGGLGRAMPAVLVLYMVGAFSISGAPLLNGFVSKSLVVAAAHEAGRPGVEWVLLLASVGTFLSVGLKLPYFAFAGPDRGLRVAVVPPSMYLAMGVTALLCLVLGTWPRVLYAWLPYEVAYQPYTAAHVLESLQILAGTGIAFAWLAPVLKSQPVITRDLDRLYRLVGRLVARRLAPAVAAGAQALEGLADRLVARGPSGRWRGSGALVGYAVLLALATLGAALAVLGRPG